MAAPGREPEDLSTERILHGCAAVSFEGKNVPSLGRYVILSRLGRGGMGVVYYGLHPRLRTEVAVKILPPDLAERTPGQAERFLREARLAARVRSEHLVQVLDVDQDEDTGLLYLVMEYVKGATCCDWLDRIVAKGDRWAPEDEALDVALAAARGLAAAHQEGIVHRDVKPENILIPEGAGGRLDLGKAKLADLGLARGEEGGKSLTGTDVAMGTPGYMAPEQAEDVKRAGRPADVFGMGATLYYLLSGEAPFAGATTMQRILATLKTDYRPIRQVRPDVSGPTAALVERCLDRDPAKRFPDAAALAASLEFCRSALSRPSEWEERTTAIAGAAPARVPTPPTALPCPSRRARPVVGIALAALLVLLGAGGTWLALRGNREPQTPAPSGERGAAPAPAPVTEDDEGPEVPVPAASILLDLSPAEGEVVGGPVLAVRGRVEGSGVHHIEVEEIARKPDGSGRFEVRLPLDDFEEGEHALRIVVVGPSGTIAQTTRRVVVDRTEPALSVAEPAGGIAVRESRVAVTGTVSEPHLVRVTVDGKEASLSGEGFRAELELAEGENEISVVATDRAGNETSATRRIVLDTIRPELVLLEPATDRITRESSLVLRGTVEDATPIALHLDGKPLGLDCSQGRFEHKIELVPGENLLRLVARDEAGNESAAERRVALDQEPPRIVLSSPREGEWTKVLEIEVRGTIEDENPSHVLVSGRRAEIATDGSFLMAVILPEGEGTIEVRALDRAENEAEPLVVHVVVDRTSPRVSVDPLAPYLEAGPVDLAGSVDE
ncbi:MAG: protein kinase, partial [Planctomycetes bacterium]|nr:protein kinase [Planctomycetota bacterium]